MKYIQITLISLITLTIVSCSKKEKTPEPDKAYTIKLIDDGKYVNPNDTTKWFTVSPLTEEDKKRFNPAEGLTYNEYRNIFICKKINFMGIQTPHSIKVDGSIVYTSEAAISQYGGKYAITNYYNTQCAIRVNNDKTFDLGILRHINGSNPIQYIFTPYEFGFIKQ